MIKYMQKEKIEQYAELFVRVFNTSPWYDEWTYETASKRIQEMMEVPTFLGMSYYKHGELIGVIFGRSEQYYDGVYFQIQEFYIDNKSQGNGFGTKLLNEFVAELKQRDIAQIYLLTIKGAMTEEFYNRKGFVTDKNMVYLYKK